MHDRDLVGLWSCDRLYAPGAQSDDWLIFMADGTGRYDWLNWRLCSSESFRWSTPRPGILRLVGERHLQIADDLRSVVEETTLLGEREVPYKITEEATPVCGRMRVLHVRLEQPMIDRFGFVRADLSGLEVADFNLEP